MAPCLLACWSALAAARPLLWCCLSAQKLSAQTPCTAVSSGYSKITVITRDATCSLGP